MACAAPGRRGAALAKAGRSAVPPRRPAPLAAVRRGRRARPGHPPAPVCPTARGGARSRAAVEARWAKPLVTARQPWVALPHKRVSPHVLRHTAARARRQHGGDRAVIALWLGHASVETPQRYLHASLALKAQAVAQTAPFTLPPGRYRPEAQLLAFLKERSLGRVAYGTQPGSHWGGRHASAYVGVRHNVEVSEAHSAS